MLPPINLLKAGTEITLHSCYELMCSLMTLGTAFRKKPLFYALLFALLFYFYYFLMLFLCSLMTLYCSVRLCLERKADLLLEDAP